ncbi:glycosyltransferase family A protein [Actinoplanes subtropicus]|uniref:glycosyltransferase family A protein n=1 Tax=Actinoplanes subtropicus TaxID=543632 RepID=UPI0004C3C80C|nr:glycosyltransferase family A protein [Actinoplanes subtropicus]
MLEALLDDHIAALGPELRLALTATVTRTRSRDGRLLLARAALGDALTLDDLLAAARAGDRRRLRKVRRKVTASLLAAIAQTYAQQELAPEDRADALALYELIRRALGGRRLNPANQALHVQLALADLGPERARALLRGYWRIKEPALGCLRADLINPYAGDRPAEPWLRAFQAMLPAPGPVVGEGDGAPFDRLAAPAVERVEEAHRVSVVVTAYRPDRGLLTAIRSILAQSWANTEIVIVDDASPPEYDEVLRAAVALGDRIRLVKLAVNGGTYAARNAGLEAAGGEFAAFQDSDDWSHPRRLELQVRPMLSDRRLVATTSDGLAVTDQLMLSRPGVRSGRFNPSSLVFRRNAVLGKVGWFDRVRKAADSEYIGRIQAAFGARRVRHLDSLPLALIRLSANSLSRSEIKPNWMHPARVAYSSAYLRWHDRIAAGVASPVRPADGSGRPFPAPGHLLGADPSTPVRYDVVMVADWRFLESPQRTAIDELRALVAAGLRVAVLQLESFRAVYLKRQPICAPLQDLINAGVVDRVGIQERVEAALVLVRQAAVLQFAGGLPSRVRAGRVVVVADRAPRRSNGTDHRYLPETCTEVARELFGAEPAWVPQDPGVRAALRTGEDRDFPTALAPGGWVPPRTAAGPGPALAGADLCDAANWPGDPAETLAVCHRLPGADLRVRLPDRPRGTLEVPLRPTWLAYEAGDLDPRPFLHQLDFYLHFPPPESAEWYSRPALEAAAMGCVVVMPERYAGLYGDAAVYCGRTEVAPLIERYRADPALFAEQSRRARSVVARAHDPALLVERIMAMLPVTAAT